MNYHPEMTLDAEDVSQVQAAIGRAFAFWASLYKDSGGVSDEVAGQVFATLAPTLSLVPSVRQRIDETEERLVRLTDEQTRIISFLDDQGHAAIVGPAGTGKTLLAVEKARRLASTAEPVLFLCYNAALRDHLSKITGCRMFGIRTFTASPERSRVPKERSRRPLIRCSNTLPMMSPCPTTTLS